MPEYNQSFSPGRHDHFDVLKGILILVIITGHNEALSYHIPPMRKLFYYFNVQCFFFLVYLLPGHPFSLKLLRDRAVRYMVPYGLSFLAAAAFTTLLFHKPLFNLERVAAMFQAFITGYENLINNAVEIRALWFLPALFSLVVLRSATLSSRRWQLGLLLSSGVWMLASWAMPRTWFEWIPFSAAVGLFYHAFGSGVAYFHEKLKSRASSWFGALCSLGAIILGAIIVAAPLGRVAGSTLKGYDLRAPGTFIAALIFPTLVFFSLLWISRYFVRVRWLKLCGVHSLFLYLGHLFVQPAITLCFYGRSFSRPEVVRESLVQGVFILVLTVAILCSGALLLTRASVLKECLLPRSWDSWLFAIRALFRKSRRATITAPTNKEGD